MPTSIFTALTRCNVFGLIYPFQEKILEKSAQSSSAVQRWREQLQQLRESSLGLNVALLTTAPHSVVLWHNCVGKHIHNCRCFSLPSTFAFLDKKKKIFLIFKILGPSPNFPHWKQCSSRWARCLVAWGGSPRSWKLEAVNFFNCTSGICPLSRQSCCSLIQRTWRRWGFAASPSMHYVAILY